MNLYNVSNGTTHLHVHFKLHFAVSECQIIIATHEHLIDTILPMFYSEPL